MASIDVIIETPKGSAQKYDFDPDEQLFRLKKILPSGMVFPYDFGFIPKTKGEDGDPLDVIVISEFQSVPGIIVKCRVLGGICAEQSKGRKGSKMIRNDRFLAVPKCSSIFGKFRSIEDIPENIFEELEAFFKDYNRLEGKKFKAVKKVDVDKAVSLISKGKTG